jgi:hypothetical protein
MMTLNVSLDGGNTWTVCTEGLIDFEEYPALLLRFVDMATVEALPSWMTRKRLTPIEGAEVIILDASIPDDDTVWS